MYSMCVYYIVNLRYVRRMYEYHRYSEFILHCVGFEMFHWVRNVLVLLPDFMYYEAEIVSE